MRSLTDGKRDPIVVTAEREQTRQHLAFAVDLAKQQHRSGRGFLLERPAGTGELAEAEIQSLLE